MTDIDKILAELKDDSVELDSTAYMTLAAYLMNACMRDTEETVKELEELAEGSEKLKNEIFDMFGYSEADFSPDIEVLDKGQFSADKPVRRSPRQ